MSPRETTYLTVEKWNASVGAAAKAAEGLLGDIKARTNGPGEAVLALIIAARALCYAHDGLPPFEWYVAQLAKINVTIEGMPKT